MGKMCIACGMPMEKKEDFATGDETKDYCHYCAREDGSMKSYDETLEYSVSWATEGDNYKFLGLENRPTEAQAREFMIENMRKLPAWQNI